MKLLFALAFVYVASADPQKCSDKLFAVNTMWFMNWTNIAPNQFCTFTFKIPKDSFAILDIEVQHAYDDTVVTVNDDFGNSIKRWQRTSNFTQNIAVPVTFDIHMKTGQETDIMVQILISVKKAEPLNRVVNTIMTDVNEPSSVIYFDQWMEGTSYILQSNNGKVNVQYALFDYLRNQEMENIFVYDGGNLIGTFMNYIVKENLVSKSNKLTLYMAKQVYEKGAVLITDNSNVENFFDHEVAFLPTYNAMNVTSTLIIGNATVGGAYTLIGAEDGSNPVTVIELDILALDPTITGQKFSVTPGGPVADLSQAVPLTNATLPRRFTANVNTFYIDKGLGSGLDKSQIHMDDWPHSHNDIVVHQQPIQHHCTTAIVTDEVRFSIIQAISHRPGIWDSQREKTSGASRKELFVQVTNEVNNQHGLEQPLSPEEVEKQWKNLKDTFIKTRKKVSYNSDGTIVQPKWKFYMHLTFLDSLNRGGKRSGSRYDEEELLPPNLIQMKRFKEDEMDEEDEYMGFCRSLVYSLREVGFKDRITWLKLQKSIRDLIHDAQMGILLQGQGQMR